MCTHCYRHALSLAVSDTIKKYRPVRDCLDTCFELVKLIKFFPKREAMLRELKMEINSDAPDLRTMYLTRWTDRADFLVSIVENYDNIQFLLETSSHATSDTEMKARIQGMKSKMQCFKFFNVLSCLK